MTIRIIVLLAILAAAAAGCAPAGDPLTLEQRLDVCLQKERPLQLEILKCYQTIAELQGGEGHVTAEQKKAQERYFETMGEDPFKATKIDLGGVTGGAAFTNKKYDDGIRVLIQPQDKTGDAVKRAGSAELELFDLAITGRDQRLGHWEFTIDQTTKAWVSGLFGISGYLFELKWPDGKPPEHAHLTLLVRFVTLEGRALSSQKDFDVRVAAEKTVEKPAEK
jgi:hypothetical protein